MKFGLIDFVGTEFGPFDFKFEPDLRLQKILELDCRTISKGSYPTEDDKVSALAIAALDMAALNFPLIRESTWKYLLEAHWEFAVGKTGDFCIPPKPRETHYFERLLSTCERIGPARAADLNAIENLDKRAAYVVQLVGDLLLEREDPDLRQTLSLVSGLPHECVYLDDPKPWDLWRLLRVDPVTESVKHVVFAFGDDAETGFVEVTLDRVSKSCTVDLDFRFRSSRNLPDQGVAMGIGLPLDRAFRHATEDLDQEERLALSVMWKCGRYTYRVS